MLFALVMASSSFVFAFEVETRAEFNELTGGWHVQVGMGANYSQYSGGLKSFRDNLEESPGFRMPLTVQFAGYNNLFEDQRLFVGPFLTFHIDSKKDFGYILNIENSINTVLFGGSFLFSPSANLEKGIILRGDVGLTNFQYESTIELLGGSETKKTESQTGLGAMIGIGFLSTPWNERGPALLPMLALSHSKAGSLESWTLNATASLLF